MADERYINALAPKIQIDPRIKFEPEHFTHIDPICAFDSTRLGAHAASMLIKNRRMLENHAELIKIKFAWSGRLHRPRLIVEIVWREAYGVKENLVFSAEFTNDEEKAREEMKALGKQRFFGGGISSLRSRIEMLNHYASNLEELERNLLKEVR